MNLFKKNHKPTQKSKALLMQIRKINKDFDPIELSNNGDWIDLRAAEDVEMKAGEFRIIKLGFSAKLPDGYSAYVIPRSSTFKNFRIIQANSFGLIDSSYSGNNDEWGFPAIALDDTVINKGDRIAQFRIEKIQPSLIIEYVDDLEGESRGGFGSTGVK